MDFQRYADQMRDYYNRRVAPGSEWDGRGYAESFELAYRGEKPFMRELADAICTALAGRDVLELAAGMGQYARFLVRTAGSVLATDLAHRALSKLDEGVQFGQQLPPGRFRSMPLDANHPERAPGSFSGALAVNWLQHMPRQQLGDWIARLHRVLRPGARVFLAINHLSPRSRFGMFYKDGDPNLWEPRKTYTGEPVDIIDNVFSRADLVALFGPHAKTIECTCGQGYYWVIYDRP